MEYNQPRPGEEKKRFFIGQIKRLTSQFGDKAYSAERINLIYDQMKFLEDQDISQVFDHFVGNAKFAPVLEDFLLKIAALRENKHYKEKEARSREIKNFFSPEEHATFIGIFNKLIDKPNPEKSASIYAELTKAMKGCRACGDEGILLALKDSMDFVFKCGCKAGQGRQEMWPLWRSQYGFKLKFPEVYTLSGVA